MTTDRQQVIDEIVQRVFASVKDCDHSGLMVEEQQTGHMVCAWCNWCNGECAR